MSDSIVKVGEVVHAGDLVTVQHGAKYYDLTYVYGNGNNVAEYGVSTYVDVYVDASDPNNWKICSDISSSDMLSGLTLSTTLSVTNVMAAQYQSDVQNKRAYELFDAKESDSEQMIYWRINDNDFAPGAFVDELLSDDTYAFAHYQNDLIFEYKGNNGRTSDGKSQILINDLSNELYYCEDNNIVLKTASSLPIQLSDCMFLRKKHRFASWKFDQDGNEYAANDIVQLSTSSAVNANWIRTFYFDVYQNGSSQHGKAYLKLPYPSNDKRYDVNTVMHVIAEPANHYHLSSWRIFQPDNLDFDDPKFENYSIAAQPTLQLDLPLTADTCVSAIFVADICRFRIVVDTLNSATVKVNMSTANVNNDIVYSSTSYDVPYNTRFSIAAIMNEDEGYRFGGWTGDVQNDDMNILNAYATGRVIIEDMTLHLIAIKLNQYAVYGMPNAVNAGRVVNEADTKNHGNGKYFEGDSAALTAIPNAGYRFVKWAIGNVDINFDYYTNVKVTGNVLKVINIQDSYAFTAIFETDLTDDTAEPLITDDGIVLDDDVQ